MSVDIRALIADLVTTGRAATASEIVTLRQRVAAAGFEPHAMTRAGGRLAGLTWQGRPIAGSDRLDISEVHYLRHVVVAQEWPAGTLMAAYVASLRSAVLYTRGAVLLDTIPGWPRLTFFAPSGDVKGPGGSNWVLVAYDVDYGYWTSGYQLDLDPERHRQVFGGVSRWLRNPDN